MRKDATKNERQHPGKGKLDQHARQRPAGKVAKLLADKARPADSQERAAGGKPRSAGHRERPMPGRDRPAQARQPSSEPRAEPSGAPIGQMRIAKAMARAGLCSRREAERWIGEGRVSVNGRVLSTPAFEVSPSDRVVVDGEPLPTAEPVRLWRYHKPRGLVTTHVDPEGRPTVFDNLPPGLPRVISIGRLDYNSEGLLLLTTDGALARHLELPATGWLRRYRVRARGRITQAHLDALKGGVTIEDVSYGPIEATLDSTQGANTWLTVGLREGKNREIRKIMAHLGLDVGRLIRVSFGPFQLLDLDPGTVEPVKRRVLAEQLGPRLARELGVVAGTEPEEKPSPGRRPTGKRGEQRKAKPGNKPGKDPREAP